MNEKQKQASDVLLKGEDGIWRCWWCGDDPEYIEYHDLEWGREVKDDFRLFEKICLEGFQAGLSWITILRKREAFRKGFKNFDFNKVAKFGDNRSKNSLLIRESFGTVGKLNPQSTTPKKPFK